VSLEPIKAVMHQSVVAIVLQQQKMHHTTGHGHGEKEERKVEIR
jgi:hypothetical protein